MSPEEFVDAIRVVVLEAAASGEIESLLDPPGRAPDAELLRMSAWFNELSETDRAMVAEVAKGTANAAVFGFLCVLDGVRAIEAAGPKGDLVVTYVGTDGVATRLNNSSQAQLHDLL